MQCSQQDSVEGGSNVAPFYCPLIKEKLPYLLEETVRLSRVSPRVTDHSHCLNTVPAPSAWPATCRMYCLQVSCKRWSGCRG